jgi:hypothetical protein
MKFPVLFLFLICSFFNHRAFSQSKDSLPAFGQVAKSDLMLNECDFDKSAEAMVLFDKEEVFCSEYAHAVDVEIKRHIRIKILNNKGVDKANIKILYLSGTSGDHVEIEGAQTYNLDGSGNILLSKLDRKNVIDKAINKRISEKIFTFPDVKTGSIIEYSYKITGPVSSGLRTWNFQSSIPEKFSRYSVVFPDDIELRYQAHCTRPVDEKTSTNKHGDNIKVFTMANVPAIRDEPYMTCEDDYIQRVESDVVAFTYEGHRTVLTDSWASIVNMFMNDEDFGQQLTRNIPGTEDLVNNLKGISDPYRKMNIVYRYVRDQMHWDGYTGIWAMEGVKTAWKNKKGSSGEINLVLVNLLKEAGLGASPILVSTRTNGRTNDLNPDWQQFDKVMARVVINGHQFIMDATNKFTPPKLIPWEVMYSDGLVVDKPETLQWGWQTLWDEKEVFNDLILINGVIDEQGNLTGQAAINSYDYARAKRMEDLKNGKDKFIEKYFSARNASLHIDSSLIENEDVDSLPLNQKLWFNQKLSSSGKYKYFSTNLFTGLEENPFKAEQRFSDIFFGANQRYTILESFIIPDGYAFDEMPKNIKLIMPDTSIVFTRNISAENDVLSMHITLEFKRPVFRVGEYEPFRDFYSKLFGLLNEQIVIKKIN